MKKYWKHTLSAVFFLVFSPLVGAILAGRPFSAYIEFPPLTRYVRHAGFSWLVFIFMATGILLVIAPFVLQVVVARSYTRKRKSSIRKFPWWGWFGVAICAASWFVAWTRFACFESFQLFTFSPLWFSYIIIINALTWRRTGRCMMLNRTKHFLVLFVVSAFFWWYFEYLNRFVQNWYYLNVENLSGFEYFWYATLPFATVLPAVMGTYEYLESFPRLSAGLDCFIVVPASARRPIAWGALTVSIIGLSLIDVFPNILYPLLWLAPLFVITSLQAINGRRTVFHEAACGDWRKIIMLAFAALICGFFWEMWNMYSWAKWCYSVPYVNRFHLFEMPLLGYAGYLPFGVECAVVAKIADEWFGGKSG